MRLVILVFSPLVVVIFINPPGDHGEGSQDTTGGERQRQLVPGVSGGDLPWPRYTKCHRLQQVILSLHISRIISFGILGTL